MKNWKFWDWTAYGTLAVAAFMMAFDYALKNAPTLAKLLPGLAESSLWAFAPSMLVVVATVILVFRGTYQGLSPKADETKSLLPPRPFPKIRYEPGSDFAFLPVHFTVELAAQFPHIEVRFFAVSFLPRPIKLTEVDLSLQLYSAAALEDITFRQKDWLVDPKDYEVVFCRRNLTDLERACSLNQHCSNKPGVPTFALAGEPLGSKTGAEAKPTKTRSWPILLGV